MKKIIGISASRGMCIGPVFQFFRQELVVSEKPNIQPGLELQRLNDAFSTAKDQIENIYQKALKESCDADAEIFQAHKMILEDPELISEVENKIKDLGTGAETAVQEAGKKFSDIMAAMNDEYFAARSTDILDVTNRVLRILLGIA
ncbi:MAG: phosphoenolpyruvate-utilizing N-terminal domain-containing protein, partial [Pelolinea sp.]|nr:phosphoenolpyruvate-utilizing N-terminal domain-containing protein [Pelolinea sp.]